ncbi:hypothetical protein ACIPYQ_37230 [Streptomyces sp. NPDC090045]|uniref:hypothetical protein n=1 Tax=Streptomyces sp. NPDC090045 TaxID=3365927 RepID=UPI00380EF43D
MTDADPDRPQPRRERRGRFEAVHLWASTAAGVVALGISLYNFSVLQRQPDIDVALPHLVRIEPRAPGGNVHLFLQPTISSRVRTEDVEIVTDAELRLSPAGSAGKAPQFYWDESGAWAYEHASNRLSYQRTSDPSPLVISQGSPQQPTILFNSHAWTIRPGRYDGVLVLHRASSPDAVEKRFCVTLSAEAVNTFTASAERTFFELRNDVPATPGPCYTF